MPDNNTIFENLFNRNFAGTGHVDHLKDIVSQHPYFSPVQFFLLKKTETGNPAYEAQLVRTNLLFNNPHWLHFQLQQKGTAAGVNENILQPETVVVSQEPEKVIDIPEESVAIHDSVMEAEPVVDIPDDMDAGPNSMIEPKPVIKIPDETDVIPDPVIISETVIDIPDATIAIQDPVIEPEPVNDMPDNTDTIPESVMESEIAPMKIELKMPVEKANLDEAMLFEPMHMVDYFASQGIKLTDEVQMADKLGKQLKSFTEWLKTMKKIHVEQVAETTPETNDSIQILAEGSNMETEVLTESMAEVFIKQGKLGKAGEVYQKLSLLNPAKSAYFAAKLENLKGK